VRRLAAAILVVVLSAALASGGGNGSAARAGADEARLSSLPLLFVERSGRIEARGTRTSVAFGPAGLSYAFRGSDAIARLSFVGARPTRPVGRHRSSTRVVGGAAYHQVVYRDLWPGIDLVFSGDQRVLKYEFAVRPGSDPRRIRMRWHGARLSLSPQGSLAIDTAGPTIGDAAPVSYQVVRGTRTPVRSSYVLHGATYSFALGEYDPRQPLVIDPAQLVYAGFFGETGSDFGNDVAVDASGAAYVVGTTPQMTALGGPDTSHNGSNDAFVAKVNPDGTAVEYLGFVGGDGAETGNTIALGGDGAAYIGGETAAASAASFPDGDGFGALPSFDSTFNGGVGDAWVAKVNPQGTALVYAGFIGGNALGADGLSGVEVDADGALHLAGATASTESSFPDGDGIGALSSFDPSFNGTTDTFVAKIAPAGTSYEWVGYLGGLLSDAPFDLALDSTGGAYVGGFTSSTETTFPDGDGMNALASFDASANGDLDGFVAKVAASGTSLDYAGFLGGLGTDQVNAVGVDGERLLVAGATASTETTFPDGDGMGALTSFDASANGATDSFVAAVVEEGTALEYAGFVGGSGFDTAAGLAVDTTGSAVVVGGTDSTETTFPDGDGIGALDSFDPSSNGAGDVWAVKVGPEGTGLGYAGFIGGSSLDSAGGVAVDANGSAYVVGGTQSSQSTFPDGDGLGPLASFDGTFGGGPANDAFLVKIAPGPPLTPPSGVGAEDITQTSLTVTWSASPDPRVTRYRVFMDGDLVGETALTELAVDGLGCGTTYAATVRGLDAGGGISAPANASVTTAACSLGPPSALAASEITQTSLTLTWAASADARVTKYAVFRDGGLIAEIAGTSLPVGGLACATKYQFAVRGRDASGGDSPPATAEATTAACPVAPPDPPHNVEEPQIVPQPGSRGVYQCLPGVWTGVSQAGLMSSRQSPSSFSFTWLLAGPQTVQTVAQTPTIRVSAVNISSRYLCRVEARNSIGIAGRADSNPAFLGGGLAIRMQPPYGNLRMKGIDVFQVVQPSAGSRHWAPGEGRFPVVGAGTPTSYGPGLTGNEPDGDPQRTPYIGVPLDATKPTTAVVYIDHADGFSYQDVEVKLSAIRNGKTFDSLRRALGSRPTDSQPWVTPEERDDQALQTTRFDVPSWWLHGGDLDLRADVYFRDARTRLTVRQCDPADCTSDDWYRLDDLPVRRLPRLDIATLELRSTGAKLDTPDKTFAPVRQVFPGGERMHFRSYAATLDVGFESRLTLRDWECYELRFKEDRSCKQYYVGQRAVQWTTDNPGSNHHALAGITDFGDGWTLRSHGKLPKDDGFLIDPIFIVDHKDELMTNAAHELGHVMTAPHADLVCGGNSDGQIGEAWPPEDRGRIQGVAIPRDGTGMFNPLIDGFSKSVAGPPVPVYDLMSYCADEGFPWISPFNWTRFFNVMFAFWPHAPEGLQPSSAVRLAQAGQAVAFGVVGAGAGRIVRLLAPDGSDQAMPVDPSSRVRVRALDGTGRLLAEVGAPVSGTTESTDGGGFAVPVPAAAQTLELVADGVLLHRLVRSRPPQVRITAPRRGTRARSRRNLAVRWTAVDPDGGALEATVDFSPDGGRTWRTVHQGPSRGRATVPSGYLQASRRARIRVAVSDGFNEASAVSQLFRADGAPPQVRIERPVAGEQLRSRGPARLQGYGRDDARRPLRGRAFTWYAGRRFLGRGDRLQVRKLPLGRVTIRLVGRDRQGRASSARVTITVRDPAPRIDALRGKRAVPARTRTLKLRVAVSAPAVLRIAGRRYRVGPKARTITIRLPTRPRSGLLRVPYVLVNQAGRTRGMVELVRTA
jgi:hypothetical protein